MSGYSESINCPRCGGEETLEHSIDNSSVDGFCINCGYWYRTIEGVTSLNELNEERKGVNLPELIVATQPLSTWDDSNMDTARQEDVPQDKTGMDAPLKLSEWAGIITIPILLFLLVLEAICVIKLFTS